MWNAKVQFIAHTTICKSSQMKHCGENSVTAWQCHASKLNLWLLFCFVSKWSIIGPLQDPLTWYGINCTGTQMTQWDFQNKEKVAWTGKSSFVLEVPLRYLRPSIIYSVPCDRILQRAYYLDLLNFKTCDWIVSGTHTCGWNYLLL